MATKLIFNRPKGGQGECETEAPVGDVVTQINRALKGDEKFITVTNPDGKKRGLVAKDVTSIRES